MILALENLLGERHENREGKIAACTKNVLVQGQVCSLQAGRHRHT